MFPGHFLDYLVCKEDDLTRGGEEGGEACEKHLNAPIDWNTMHQTQRVARERPVLVSPSLSLLDSCT